MTIRQGLTLSPSPINSSISDMGELVKLVGNSWIRIYTELFNAALLSIPKEFVGADLKVPVNRRTTFEKYLFPIAANANRKRIDWTVDKIDNQLSETDDIRLKAGLVPEEMDFDAPTGATRIINPRISDIIPEVFFSYEVFGENHDALNAINGGVVKFPYGEIPMMTLIPDNDAVTRKYNRVHDKWIKATSAQYKNDTPVLEISAYSFLSDLGKLLAYWDADGKKLSDEGNQIGVEIIHKWVNFTVPLIMVSLRRNYECGIEFANVVFNHFQQTFESATIGNRFCFAATDDLLHSLIGKHMVQLYGLKFAVSTIDLIGGSQFNVDTLLQETIPNTISEDYTKNYMDYLEDLGFDFDPVFQIAKQEREATVDIVDYGFDIILNILSSSVGINGFVDTERRLSRNVRNMVRAIEEYVNMCGDMYVYTIIGRILNALKGCLDHTNLNALVTKIASSQKINPSSSGKTVSFDKMYRFIPSITDIKRSNLVGTTEIALECNDEIKRILDTKLSFPAMRILTTECKDIASYEDAEYIKMETAMYKEAMKKSTANVNFESGDNVLFANFLNKVEAEVNRWEKEFLETY